jgi:hypothetical protein
MRSGGDSFFRAEATHVVITPEKQSIVKPDGKVLSIVVTPMECIYIFTLLSGKPWAIH